MSIVGLDQVGSRAAKTQDPKASAMGKEDFLNLLVTQLQHQDPLNPMDSTGFSAQLAQFSSLEELQNINETLGSVGNSQTILTNSQAVDYIGKRVQAVGDQLELTSGQPVSIEFNLNQDAAGVYVRIYNQFGEYVQDLEPGPLTVGLQSVSWDGMNHQNQPAPDGTYRYEVMAMDADGNTMSVTSFTSGTVSGVYYKNGLAYLLTASQEIPLGNVVQVYE
ncbi:MAG: flagellar hook capping FlgD N-terminal domain-containing protein [Desulfobacteraceae bacterium]